jgi:alginate O-acetyltransferase complex protein AlgJ
VRRGGRRETPTCCCSATAGFAEHLSRALRRPVDRIVQNDAGAYATRAQVHGSPLRLAGKRVVIYQFAARELSFGDWKIFENSSQ